MFIFRNLAFGDSSIGSGCVYVCMCVFVKREREEEKEEVRG